MKLIIDISEKTYHFIATHNVDEPLPEDQYSDLFFAVKRGDVRGNTNTEESSLTYTEGFNDGFMLGKEVAENTKIKLRKENG